MGGGRETRHDGARLAFQHTGDWSNSEPARAVRCHVRSVWKIPSQNNTTGDFYKVIEPWGGSRSHLRWWACPLLSCLWQDSVHSTRVHSTILAADTRPWPDTGSDFGLTALQTLQFLEISIIYIYKLPSLKYFAIIPQTLTVIHNTHTLHAHTISML